LFQSIGKHQSIEKSLLCIEQIFPNVQSLELDLDNYLIPSIGLLGSMAFWIRFTEAPVQQINKTKGYNDNFDTIFWESAMIEDANLRHMFIPTIVKIEKNIIKISGP
jgi:hypothetical protein